MPDKCPECLERECRCVPFGAVTRALQKAASDFARPRSLRRYATVAYGFIGRDVESTWIGAPQAPFRPQRLLVWCGEPQASVTVDALIIGGEDQMTGQLPGVVFQPNCEPLSFLTSKLRMARPLESLVWLIGDEVQPLERGDGLGLALDLPTVGTGGLMQVRWTGPVLGVALLGETLAPDGVRYDPKQSREAAR